MKNIGRPTMPRPKLSAVKSSFLHDLNVFVFKRISFEFQNNFKPFLNSQLPQKPILWTHFSQFLSSSDVKIWNQVDRKNIPR